MVADSLHQDMYAYDIYSEYLSFNSSKNTSRSTGVNLNCFKNPPCFSTTRCLLKSQKSTFKVLRWVNIEYLILKTSPITMGGRISTLVILSNGILKVFRKGLNLKHNISSKRCPSSLVITTIGKRFLLVGD